MKVGINLIGISDKIIHKMIRSKIYRIFFLKLDIFLKYKIKKNIIKYSKIPMNICSL